VDEIERYFREQLNEDFPQGLEQEIKELRQRLNSSTK